MKFFRVFIEELFPADFTINALEERSVGDIASVGDISDAIFRNALITHNYWRIASRFYDRFGMNNLVWPTFGSWASAQAGLYMRMGLARSVRYATVKRSERVTFLLGLGNQLIFRDIAPPFWKFLDMLDAMPEDQITMMSQDPDLGVVLAHRLGLDPRTLAQSPDGQFLMILAFEQYLRALVTQDPDERAERIFVANACIGLQEQSRVDCMLNAMLDVPELNQTISPFLRAAKPPLHYGGRAASRAWPLFERLLGVDAPKVRLRLKNYRHLLNSVVMEGRASQVFGTQIFLELQLGEDYFDLGRDITRTEFARGLEEITLEAVDFQKCFDMVTQWDKTPNSTTGTAAVDWSNLSDRMNFILDLFRCYQSESRLTEHPLQGKVTR